MDISNKLMLLLVLYINIYGLDNPSINALPETGDFIGNMNYHIDTLLVVYFGEAKDALRCPENGLCFGPNAFDIDEDGCIYVLNMDMLHKFGNDETLLFSKKLSRRVIDVAYYKNNIFMLTKDRLIALNKITAKNEKEIYLKSLNIINYGIRKTTYFYDRYVFFRDFNPLTFQMRLRFVFDLDSMRLSSEILNDEGFCLVTRCKKCNGRFIRNLFNPLSLTHYLSQSEKYLLYTYSCDPRINKECEKETGINYYIMDKKTGSVKSLGSRFNMGIGKRISLLVTRPVVFNCDTSAIFQTMDIIKNKPRCIVYNKITFNQW